MKFNNLINRSRKLVEDYHLNIVLVLSMLGVLGSLYFSDVVGLDACKACWYQRIALYPIVPITIVAQLTKVKQAYKLILPLSIIGMVVAGFQVADVAFGWNLLDLINCGDDSCTDLGFQLFGILTIPMQSLLLFLTINIVLTVRALKDYVK